MTDSSTRRRRRRRSRGRGAIAALFAVLAGACRSGDKPPTVAVPAGPPEVVVTMLEYRYGYDKTIPPGRVLFRFVNAGRVAHRPIVLPLAEHLPPIDVQVRGSVRQVVPPFAGLTTRKAGTSGTIALDLLPGQRYAFICTAPDPDGRSHAANGMNAEFRTSGPPNTTGQRS